MGARATTAATLPRIHDIRFVVLMALLAAAAAAGLLAVVALGPAGVDPLRALALLFAPDASADSALVHSVRLPRAVAALVAGAALGASGALLQAVVRNPLADIGTVGVGSGAWLAVAIAAVAGVSAGGWAAVPFAFVGGMLAAVLAFGVAGGLRADPVRVVLAGVAISFACAAGVSALQVLYEQRTSGVFLWGAGSVEQPGWAAVRGLWWTVPALLAAAAVMARALDALDAGDETAVSVGVSPGKARLLAGFVAICLASVAVALVGPISFVGLAAAHVARRVGMLGHRVLVPASAAIGSVLLVAADSVALAIGGEQVPAGVVCTALGAPLLIVIARRAPVRGAASTTSPRRRRVHAAHRPLLGATIALAAGLVALVAALSIGEVSLPPAEVLAGLVGRGDSAFIVQELRLPRALVAALAGGALAVCGTLLQGAARNPLAGPELIGVTGGGALGAMLAITLGVTDPLAYAGAAFLGGVVALAVVLAVTPRRLDPERLALVGVAVAGAALAIVHVLVLRAGPELGRGVVLLAGTTYAEGWSDFARLLPILLGATVLALLLGRTVDVLATGDELAIGLGVRPALARLGILGIAVVLAAAAVATVGAIGFVGLLAPHAARMFVGPAHRSVIPVSAVLGAGLLLVADLAGRSVLDGSRELPSGVVTALIGAPLLLLLMRRRA